MFKKLIIYLVLSIVFITSSWSFFRSDFFYAHDFTHGARIAEMHRALKDGHFPVRWSESFGFGYGMPLFEFYAPLPYYVGAVFYAVGFSLVNSVKLLFIISTLVVLIGGYKLGKVLFGSLGGLIVTSAITLAPYRAVNLFVRGALSELWGIMVLPYILYGIILVIQKKKNGWLTLLASFIILLLSHNLTTLIFVPLSIVFGALYLIMKVHEQANWKKYFLERVAILIGTYFLSFLIASFYLIPAILEKNFTRLETAILGNYFDYNLHFVYVRQFFESNWKYGGSSWGPYDSISFYLGFGQILGLGLTLFIFSKILFSNQIKNKFIDKYYLLLISILLLGISTFMSIGRSKFIWDSIEILSFIQFPWRWLSAVIIFLGLIIGFMSILIHERFKRICLSFLIIFVIIFSNSKFFQPEKFIENYDDFYYSDSNKIRSEMSKTLPDFIPEQIKDTTISPIAPEGKLLMCEDECEFEFTKILNKTQKKVIDVKLDNPELVGFTIAHFPGWEAEIDGNSTQYQVSNFGMIVVPVEAGAHKISLEFKSTKIRLASDLTSIFGLVIFISIFFWYHRRNE